MTFFSEHLKEHRSPRHLHFQRIGDVSNTMVAATSGGMFWNTSCCYIEASLRVSTCWIVVGFTSSSHRYVVLLRAASIRQPLPANRSVRVLSDYVLLRVIACTGSVGGGGWGVLRGSNLQAQKWYLYDIGTKLDRFSKMAITQTLRGRTERNHTSRRIVHIPMVVEAFF